MDLEVLKQFIQPEIMVLVPVVYLLGTAAKKSEFVQDRYIPIYLGVVSILLTGLYVLSTTLVCAASIFMAITQGILVAGASVYCNQVVKQMHKDDK
ncbi:MAG: phage holin family protein [Bacilli bacterium]